MTASLEKYLLLMEQSPQLFRNTGEAGEIFIFTNLDQIKEEVAKLKAAYRAQGKLEEWIDIGVLVDDPWYWVVRDLVKFPNGRIGGHIRILNRKSMEGGWGVVVLPFQGEGMLILRHYRHDDRNWHWEFPRGFGEPGLDPEQNARKEMFEEIGVNPEKLIRLGQEPESEHGGIAYFYAKIPENVELKLDDEEGISTIEHISIKDFENWLIDGRMTDAFSLKVFLLYQMARKDASIFHVKEDQNDSE